MSSSLEIIRTILLYINLPVFTIGLIGNILAFIIYSRKKFENTPFRIYYQLLLITDSVTLSLSLDLFLSYISNITVTYSTTLFCLIYNYSLFVSAPTSDGILIYLSFDRMINLIYPGKFLWRNKLFSFII